MFLIFLNNGKQPQISFNLPLTTAVAGFHTVDFEANHRNLRLGGLRPAVHFSRGLRLAFAVADGKLASFFCLRLKISLKNMPLPQLRTARFLYVPVTNLR